MNIKSFQAMINLQNKKTDISLKVSSLPQVLISLYDFDEVKIKALKRILLIIEVQSIDQVLEKVSF